MSEHAADVAETSSASGRGFVLGMICVAIVAAIYVLMPVANFTDAKDSLRYASRISEDAPFFHPNHLLYEPVIHVIWRAVQAVAGPVDPLHVMQGVSIACALPFLLCCYLLVWRGNRNAAAAGLATGAVGFCFGVWVYAVSPDGYLPPLALSVFALVLLDPDSWRHRADQLPRGLLIGAALATAAAVLIHQMYVFFALVAGFAILIRPEFGGRTARLRDFAIYGGLSGGLVLLVYVLVYLRIAPDAALLDWARGFAKDELYYGDPPSLLSPVKGAVGAVSTMLTMNGLMGIEPIADRLTSAFPNKSLYEEAYIAQTAIPGWLRWPIVAAMAGAVLLWLAMAAQALQVRRGRASSRYVDLVLLVAVIVYAVAVIIWEPTNREFWIQTYVFATLWCLRRIPRLTRARLAVTGGLVGCLFTVNFFAALGPLSDARTDYWRVYNAEAIARRGEFDVIITSCTWLCGWYLRYFASAEVWSPAGADVEALRARIDAVGEDRVLISSLAYAPHRLAFIHAPRLFDPALTDAFAAAYPPPEPVSQDDASQRFYRLEDGVVVPLPPGG